MASGLVDGGTDEWLLENGQGAVKMKAEVHALQDG